MVLIGDKELSIQKAKKKDAQEIIDYCNKVGGESDYLSFGANEFPFTLQQEEESIEKLKGSSAEMFIGRIDNKIVSIGSIRVSDKKRFSHHCEIGISVLKEFWGLGIGKHIMSTIINYARCDSPLEMLYLYVRADNTRAIELYKNLGFAQTGYYTNHIKLNGEYFDEISMGLVL